MPRKHRRIKRKEATGFCAPSNSACSNDDSSGKTEGHATRPTYQQPPSFRNLKYSGTESPEFIHSPLHTCGGGGFHKAAGIREREGQSKLKDEGWNADCLVKTSARLTQRGNYCLLCTG